MTTVSGAAQNQRLIPQIPDELAFKVLEYLEPGPPGALSKAWNNAAGQLIEAQYPEPLRRVLEASEMWVHRLPKYLARRGNTPTGEYYDPDSFTRLTAPIMRYHSPDLASVGIIFQALPPPGCPATVIERVACAIFRRGAVWRFEHRELGPGGSVVSAGFVKDLEYKILSAFLHQHGVIFGYRPNLQKEKNTL